jgi:hypothetical protein
MHEMFEKKFMPCVIKKAPSIHCSIWRTLITQSKEVCSDVKIFLVLLSSLKLISPEEKFLAGVSSLRCCLLIQAWSILRYLKLSQQDVLTCLMICFETTLVVQWVT